MTTPGRVLVIGAGIAGIRASLDLAEAGLKVTLIDRAAHGGGLLGRLDRQFADNHCGMCKLLPMADRDAAGQHCLRRGLSHANIEILPGTELQGLDGEAGNFTALLREQPRLLDPNLCTGCGRCETVCPVEIPDPFNMNLTRRKAVARPTPHVPPNFYNIDTVACTRCGECEKICPFGAIRLQGPAGRDFRILVVDDELIMRDSLKEWLIAEGYHVDMAASGQEALDLLGAAPYHLMLVDIKMPGMDGVEVLQHVKSGFSDVRVLMMTAYATVDTAVQAMKDGALDYLMKPFDPEALMPKVRGIYEAFEAARLRREDVGAVILCAGVDDFDPAGGPNTLAYGESPDVMTHMSFERLLSNAGPYRGQLLRPSDQRPIRRVAWIQCVGSRDLKAGADFCSTVCCMIALKQACLAREKAGDGIECVIFFMDLRTWGKSFQRFSDQAVADCGVKLVKSRVHSVVQDQDTRDLVIRYMDAGGQAILAAFDAVVLSVGQRPQGGMAELAARLDIDLNPDGFCQTQGFSEVRTRRDGILVAGACAGIMDISHTLVRASAAALNAARVIRAHGGDLALCPEPFQTRDVSREPVDILVLVSDGKMLPESAGDMDLLVSRLQADPGVGRVRILAEPGTDENLKAWEEAAAKQTQNRILAGVRLPGPAGFLKNRLAKAAHLPSALVEVVPLHSGPKDTVYPMLAGGIAALKAASPQGAPKVSVIRSALVIGGGIAGLTAALAIADHGFQVDLVEKEAELGGNLKWLNKNLEGHEFKDLLSGVRDKIEAHPLVTLHLGAKVLSTLGQVGSFVSLVEDEDGKVGSLSHGVVILATGGREHVPQRPGRPAHPAIFTQAQFEQKLAKAPESLKAIGTLVMILCVESREEPRNYCSRICCPTALKHIFAVQAQNPEASIYVLYRDMMTIGFSEAFYTQARQSGAIFIPYDPARKPEIGGQENGHLEINVLDPVLQRQLSIRADCLVLGTGIEPVVPREWAAGLGIEIDTDGFFKEADQKWRPTDAMAQGIFACGLALSPGSVTQAMAQAEAAAMRALRVLTHADLSSGRVVAKIRTSWCALCERCIAACPYGARHLDPDEGMIRINPVLCQGCGACALVCPSKAAVVEGFLPGQMMAVIDAALTL